MSRDGDAIGIDPVGRLHVVKQRAQGFNIRPYLTSWTLRRHDDKRKVRLAFYLVREGQLPNGVYVCAPQRAAMQVQNQRPALSDVFFVVSRKKKEIRKMKGMRRLPLEHLCALLCNVRGSGVAGER